MCYNKHYLRNPVSSDHRTFFDKFHLNVPCGKCPACRQARSCDWLVRSYFELKDYKGQAFFITLDFDNAHLPTYHGVPCFDSTLIQAFIDRLRHDSKVGSFRYLYSTDYGGFLLRPHYHMMVLPSHIVDDSAFYAAVNKHWWYGHFTNIQSLDSVGSNWLKAAQYIASYVTKDVTFGLNNTTARILSQGKDIKLPPRYNARTTASKHWGMSAITSGSITFDMIKDGKKIALPVGTNGELVPFLIPRYYEMHFCYDSYWDKETKRQVFIKNKLGAEVSLTRYNRHYVFRIRQFFASRWDSVSLDGSPFESSNWYSLVASCLSDFEDFKEFMYCKDLICKVTGSDYHLFTSDDVLYRPNWSYYSSVYALYERYKKQLDKDKLSVESDNLFQKARKRAIYKLNHSPRLVRYLRSRHFDFSVLFNNS